MTDELRLDYHRQKQRGRPRAIVTYVILDRIAGAWSTPMIIDF